MVRMLCYRKLDHRVAQLNSAKLWTETSSTGEQNHCQDISGVHAHACRLSAKFPGQRPAFAVFSCPGTYGSPRAREPPAPQLRPFPESHRAGSRPQRHRTIDADRLPGGDAAPSRGGVNSARGAGVPGSGGCARGRADGTSPPDPRAPRATGARRCGGVGGPGGARRPGHPAPRPAPPRPAGPGPRPRRPRPSGPAGAPGQPRPSFRRGLGSHALHPDGPRRPPRVALT